VGAPQLHAQAGSAEAVDRHSVEVLGGLAVADQCPRAGLGTKRPVGAAGAGDAGEPLEGAGRALGSPLRAAASISSASAQSAKMIAGESSLARCAAASASS
jgi:hypothetical protein